MIIDNDNIINNNDNFQSYHHLTFPEEIEKELNIVLVLENFRLFIRFLAFMIVIYSVVFF